MSKPINTIPNRYLAKILQLNHSTISLYKKAASGAGYITTEHQYEDLQLQIKFLYPLQKSLLEEAHLLVTHDNSVQRQFPDEITSTIRLKRKRMYPT